MGNEDYIRPMLKKKIAFVIAAVSLLFCVPWSLLLGDGLSHFLVYNEDIRINRRKQGIIRVIICIRVTVKVRLGGSLPFKH